MGRFLKNPFFDRELAREAEFRLHMKTVAIRGADAAKRIARAEAFDTGDYHDSIEGVVVTEGNETSARVIAGDWKALLIELGTTRRPATATLRKAAESISDRYRAAR